MSNRFIAFVIVLLSLFANIASAQIRFATSEEPPTNYTDNGKLVGTTVDIVKEMIRLSGKKIDIEVYPWARTYKMVTEEPNMFVFTAGKTQERADLGLQFIGPVITRNHALISLKKTNFNISKIEDLKNHTIGGLNGDWRAKYFQDLGHRVDLGNSYETNFKKLSMGRIDFVISSDMELGPNAAKAGVNADDLKIAWVFRTAPSYILVSKGTPGETVRSWQDLYSQVARSGVMEKEAKKWGQTLGIPFAFSPDKGFFVP